MTTRKPRPAPSAQKASRPIAGPFDFPIGAVVHLKSGGTAMTVTGEGEGGVQVVWSRYDDFQERAFDPRLLVLCTARRPYHDETPF